MSVKQSKTKEEYQRTIKLIDYTTIRENIQILQELEFIITKELGADSNPAKIGMYMKLLWEMKN